MSGERIFSVQINQLYYMKVCFNMKITVNTQSSIRIEADGKVIRFDPFRLPDAPHDADVIFITHAHFDHFSPDDLTKAAKASTYYIFPGCMFLEAIKFGVPAGHLLLATPETEQTVCGFPFLPVTAYNTNKPMHRRVNGWLGYVLTAEGKRIYVTGDTDDIREGRAVKCDILMLPIGGTYTMDPAEAAAFTNAVHPAEVIPTHYGTLVGTITMAETFRSAVAPDIKVTQKLFV